MAAHRFDPPLVRGTLVRRYKRFLADVRLSDGRVVVAHTPNTGAMLTCSDPGSRVFLSRAAPSARRRLRYTLELVESRGTLVGVNTQLPNRLVARSVEAGDIVELAGYDEVRREVPAGRSRIDLELRRPGGRCFVEIKNVTLVQRGVAGFPDAVTARGRRHLEELCRQVVAGHRGVVFFLVQRTDCHRMGPADDIDPAYGRALRRVVARGVEALVYQAAVSPRAVTLWRRIPLELA